MNPPRASQLPPCSTGGRQLLTRPESDELRRRIDARRRELLEQEGNGRRVTAVEFVADLLADGPRRRTDALRAGADAGYRTPALRHARQRLELIVYDSEDGTAWWRLPERTS